MPCARSIAENIASGSSNMVWVGAIFSSIMYGITTVILSIRLNNRKPAIAVGNISRGKYTCWMRAALETRHAVQLLNVLEKELKMRNAKKYSVNSIEQVMKILEKRRVLD